MAERVTMDSMCVVGYAIYIHFLNSDLSCSFVNARGNKRKIFFVIFFKLCLLILYLS